MHLNHVSEFSSAFAKLLNDPEDADVIITTGRKQEDSVTSRDDRESISNDTSQQPRDFFAHSIILKTQSVYYANALKSEWATGLSADATPASLSSSPPPPSSESSTDQKALTKSSTPAGLKKRISHPDIEPDVYNCILQYIYSGKVDIPDALLLQVALAANQLLFTSTITLSCIDYFEKKLLVPENSLLFFEAAQVLNMNNYSFYACHALFEELDDAVGCQTEILKRMSMDEISAFIGFKKDHHLLKWKLVLYWLLARFDYPLELEPPPPEFLKSKEVIESSQKCIEEFLQTASINMFAFTKDSAELFLKPFVSVIPDVLRLQLHLHYGVSMPLQDESGDMSHFTKALSTMTVNATPLRSYVRLKSLIFPKATDFSTFQQIINQTLFNNIADSQKTHTDISTPLTWRGLDLNQLQAVLTRAPLDFTHLVIVARLSNGWEVGGHVVRTSVAGTPFTSSSNSSFIFRVRHQPTYIEPTPGQNLKDRCPLWLDVYKPPKIAMPTHSTIQFNNNVFDYNAFSQVLQFGSDMSIKLPQSQPNIATTETQARAETPSTLASTTPAEMPSTSSTAATSTTATSATATPPVVTTFSTTPTTTSSSTPSSSSSMPAFSSATFTSPAFPIVSLTNRNRRGGSFISTQTNAPVFGSGINTVISARTSFGVPPIRNSTPGITTANTTTTPFNANDNTSNHTNASTSTNSNENNNAANTTTTTPTTNHGAIGSPNFAFSPSSNARYVPSFQHNLGQTYKQATPETPAKWDNAVPAPYVVFLEAYQIIL
jgi:hypothetical protein